MSRHWLSLTGAMLAVFCLPAAANGQSVQSKTELKQQALNAGHAGEEAPSVLSLGLLDEDVAEAEWPRLSASPDGQTIYLVGELQRGSYRKFLDILADNPDAQTVYLASPGGFVWDGFLIGATMRLRGMDSYVEHYCASACTQIFVAGKQRVLGPNAVLGFHQSYTDEQVESDTLFGPASDDQASPGAGMMEQSYRRAGLSDDFIAAVAATPYDEMWFPTAEELALAGVITRHATSAEIRPDAALFVSRESVERHQPDSLFWGALQQEEPELYEHAAQFAWRIANSGMTVEAAWQEARADMTDRLGARMALAPDYLLNRFGDIMLELSQFERQRGYAACDGSSLNPRTGVDDGLAAYDRESDTVYAALLHNRDWRDRSDMDLATKAFADHVDKLFSGKAAYQDSALFGNKCVASVRIMESIGSLDGDQRLSVLRGLLYLGAREEAGVPDS